MWSHAQADVARLKQIRAEAHCWIMAAMGRTRNLLLSSFGASLHEQLERDARAMPHPATASKDRTASAPSSTDANRSAKRKGVRNG